MPEFHFDDYVRFALGAALPIFGMPLLNTILFAEFFLFREHIIYHIGEYATGFAVHVAVAEYVLQS